MTRKKREINTSLLDSVTADMLGGGGEDFFHDDSLRVERILLDLVRPDPLQPRRVLPDRIYQAFHAERMTPSQALRELIQIAQLAARQQGRPFTNVLDLLGNPDEESDEDPQPLSPEEQLVRDLVNLAVTIRDDGQVNPLTVVDVSQGVMRQYRIETGERRYWATWLLRDFIPGYESDGMIPCIIIPPESASAFRQAKENTARSGLSAIAMARQIALLLLQIHGYPMPEGPVNYDFYRQSLELDLRGKREFTALLLSSLGGIHKRQLSRFKSLLKLCDEALELADRHQIDESHLRLILHLEAEDQVEVLRQCVAFNLTRKQLQDLLDKGNDEVNEEEKFPKQVIQLARLMKHSRMPDPAEIARALINQEGNTNVARAKLQLLKDLLIETEKYLPE